MQKRWHQRLRCGTCQTYIYTQHVRSTSSGAQVQCSLCTPKRSKAPMISIEVDEHTRLLKLYYSSFEEATTVLESKQSKRLKALEECNRFYEGTPQCQQ